MVDVKVTDPVLKWDALPSATWYWWVCSFDAESCPSEWSASRTIAPATGSAALKAPPEGAQLVCGEDGVQLEAEPQGGLKSYQLEVAGDARFLDPKTDTN